MNDANTEVLYPRLLRRVRAFLVDTILFIIVIYTWLLSLSALVQAPFLVKLAALLVPIIILEPVLVAFTGGTVGHHLFGLRIRDASRDRNIGMHRAAARAIVRSLLGWLSFVFVLVTKRHQALHDYFTSTIVVLRRPESLPEHEKHVARSEDRTQYIYPSAGRRIAVILLYAFLGIVVIAVLAFAGLSERCLHSNHCTPGETLFSGLLDILSLASLGASIVLGWRGLLYGCRRSRVPLEASPGDP